MPLAQLNKDLTRERVDVALCEAFSLPILSSIGELLAREPGLSAVNINSLEDEGGA